ncbi:rna-directed dna polymerase from mobile element jockey-like [Limosa lapponica baueri]|uniref:Rna-directed dna polymerase from mobile element jockey-like n=1 Tax=Limosa lapponica baueri TaxID=1758121 RepID=A0A2I0TWU8_LIMLA|nr:rna-directed dna polymerase from mobile element jockey-like [Limosa lapponica baueri]
MQMDWLPGDREGKQNEGITINEEEISDLLHHLDAHRSMGPDVLHPRVLKESADVLAKLLSIIYMKSWLTGEVPMDWRVANVTPIYKKGKKEDPGNYRPISLTSIPGKVMGQVILSELSWQVQDSQGIRASQHGFMKGRSCLTNLISFYDHVTRLLDRGKAVDVVYLDFCKAFDTVPSSVLLRKLANHGIDKNFETSEKSGKHALQVHEDGPPLPSLLFMQVDCHSTGRVIRLISRQDPGCGSSWSRPEKELPPSHPETAVDADFFLQAHLGWVPRGLKKDKPGSLETSAFDMKGP